MRRNGFETVTGPVFLFMDISQNKSGYFCSAPFCHGTNSQNQECVPVLPVCAKPLLSHCNLECTNSRAREAANGIVLNVP